MILVITVRERETHVHLSAGLLLKRHARVEFSFTPEFGHVSEAAFTMCGNSNKVISTEN